MYACSEAGVRRGLGEYTNFVETKRTELPTPDMREVTHKPGMMPLQEMAVESTFKASPSAVPVMAMPPPPMAPVAVDPAGEEDSAMVEEEEENRMREYELIIQQSDGPQTAFFSVKEDGAKIGRHSSNQILILDESISRYHAEIKFENGQFFLKDIGSTTGTFIKIQEPRVIENVQSG